MATAALIKANPPLSRYLRARRERVYSAISRPPDANTAARPVTPFGAGTGTAGPPLHPNERTERMPRYEHTFIARQDLSAQQAQALGETFTQLVAEQGGEVGKVEYWGLRSLTYRINKNRKGHYLHMNIEAPAATLEELERTERLHEDVLRYLTLKVEQHHEGPSVIMQAKSSREERSRRDRP
jgi:small subunit ribosomal protein S6